jgi:hypothetical protein
MAAAPRQKETLDGLIAPLRTNGLLIRTPRANRTFGRIRRIFISLPSPIRKAPVQRRRILRTQLQQRRNSSASSYMVFRLSRMTVVCRARADYSDVDRLSAFGGRNVR